MSSPSLILASSSPFRRELLSRLNIDFESISPDIDETPMSDEPPAQYVKRLAAEKSQVIAKLHPAAVTIGSDQCAFLDGQILGKPGSHEKALQQLQNAQGKEVTFYTGLSVQQQESNFCETDCVIFTVGFRELAREQLEHYLLTEKPYNCAGSFKSEAYGISLFSYMRGDDPTALVGLPLIRLTDMLESAGIRVV